MYTAYIIKISSKHVEDKPNSRNQNCRGTHCQVEQHVIKILILQTSTLHGYSQIAPLSTQLLKFRTRCSKTQWRGGEGAIKSRKTPHHCQQESLRSATDDDVNNFNDFSLAHMLHWISIRVSRMLPGP